MRKTSMIVTTLVLFALLSSSFSITFKSASATSDQTLESTSSTKIFLDPSMVLTEPDQTFQANLAIAAGSDVYSWGVRVSWDIYHVNLTSATKGPFLEGLAIITFFTFNPNYLSAYADIGCTRIGEIPGVDGDGVLAYLTFKSLDVGESDITFSNAKIVHSDLSEEYPPTEGAHVTSVAPSPPKADFTWASDPPTSYIRPSEKPLVINRPVTFNATYEKIGATNYGSYDPDGGSLTDYKWDFGDGNVTSGVYPIITHVYEEVGYYPVNLTVTDDEGLTAFKTQQIQIVIVDVAIIDVKPSTTQVFAGESVTITVSVKNVGTIIAQKVNITAYYFNSTFIGKIGNYTNLVVPVPPWYEGGQGPFYFKDVTITWKTAGVSLGTYTIKANVTEALWGEENLVNNEFINGEVTIATVSIIPYSVTIGGVSFNGIIKTNSILSRSGFPQFEVAGPINFNVTRKELSFNVTGPSGTMGFCNVTIPMKLLNAIPPTAWSVLLNGSSIDYSLATNATHSFLYFTYPHSTSKIQIIGTSAATPPVTKFIASKTEPLIGEIIYFDATESYDPDGSIVYYTWDFGDENKTTVTVPIIYHAYQTVQDFTVALTLTDNDGLNTTLSRFKYIQVQRRDIAVVSVEFSPTSVPVGGIVSIKVTVKNNGDFEETFNVAVYYDNTLIETYQVVNLSNFNPNDLTANVNSTTIYWNTSGVHTGNYEIRAEAPISYDINPTDNIKIGGTVTIEKAIPDFSITAFPTSLTIVQGCFGTSTIKITSINNFNNPVDLAVLGAPSGVTATLSPTQVTPPINDSVTSTLTVSVSASVPLGSYTLMITGKSGTLIHWTEIYLEVTQLISTTLFIDPPESRANPGATFTITINVGNVYDLFAWEVKLSWNSTLLNVTDVIEGPFLKVQPAGTYFAFRRSENIPGVGTEGYIVIYCTTIGEYKGVSGSGILASVTFLVEDHGTSILDLYDTILIDSKWVVQPGPKNFITHTTEDGFFTTIVEPYEDTTPPTITINEPQVQEYLHSESIDLDFSAVDLESGMASISAILDEAIVISGQTIDLYTLSLGHHTLTVTAVDNAGNTATKSVTFTVIATIDSLISLVQKFFENEASGSSLKETSLENHYTSEVENSLLDKLFSAKAQIEKGRKKPAINILNAFINQVKAQAGKALSAEEATILITDARYVIQHL